MRTINEKEFRSEVFDYAKASEWKFAGARPALIDFYADWCGPCRALSPILEEISREYAGRLDVFKVDTEASPELSSVFGIRSIPSLLFVPMQGKPVMAAGLLPKAALKQALRDVLKLEE